MVSEDWKKDYESAPPKYAMLGATELAIFDPVACRGAASASRIPLQVYRREDDGAFVRVHADIAAAYSETLGCWLAPRPENGVGWLRLSEHASGEPPLPTEGERGEQEAARAEQEAARAEQEAARAEQEAARAEQEAARAEKLRAQLEALGVDPDA